MKNSIMLAAAGFAATMLLSQAGVVNAAEIKVMSANGLQEVMENLGPKFERVSGHKLAITFATEGGVVKLVQDGKPTDVVIVTGEGIDNLVKYGNAAAGNVTVIAHGEIAVAVRKGAPKPDIWSLEALKRTLLAAKSITYIDPALGSESGIHVADQIERLGIANEMKAKTVLAKPRKMLGSWLQTVQPRSVWPNSRYLCRSPASSSSVRCRLNFRRPLSFRRQSWPAPRTPRQPRRWSISCTRRRRRR